MTARARAAFMAAVLALPMLVLPVLILPLWVPPAAAQEPVERRTLFQMLFGTPQRRYVDEYPRRPVVTKPRPRKRTPTGNVAAPEMTEPAVEKLENAKKILVVGDFLAGGLSEGMKIAFETSPGIVVEGRANVASGLVRDDYYNWQEQLPKYIDEIKPAMVVVLIGANDRQQMAIANAKEKFRTDAWLKEYEARSLALAKIATGRGLPLLWVGLPAFESPSMTSDAAQFNGIFRAQTEKAGGEFVDVWDGFVDENGKFVITGSDINGQQVRLRGSDGMNLTKAGRRKIAFYVEKAAKRLLGDPIAQLIRLDAGNLPAGNLPELAKLPPAEKQAIVRTQPISLSDPELDGGTELLGAGTAPAATGKSARDLLVEKGEMPPAPAGRVDDYRLSPQAGLRQSMP